ncbi:MAG: amidohydrolase [Armatimonadetes bacterium]|nr:amidohydrolase [Armatimonadota bacterium]
MESALADWFGNGTTPSGKALAFSVEGGRFKVVAEAPPEGVSFVDLDGAVVLPGFIDAHCHIIPTGLDLQKLHLGACSTRDEVLQALEAWSGANDSPWIQAVHYDQTKFDDSQHLTRDEIDRVVSDRPVLLRHTNGHASVANSAALVEAAVDDSTPDPAGGSFVRDSGGRLTGVLLERAHERVTSAAPQPTQEELTDAVLRAGEEMARLGITCATDMMTGRWNLGRELAAYKEASERGCKVRLRLYAQWGTVLGPRGITPSDLTALTAGMQSDVCRLAGLKIFADGAIGSATAAIYGQFLTTGGNGQLIYEPERLQRMIIEGTEKGWGIAVHTIGDRSTDLVMDAMEASGQPGMHRIEHAMLLSDAQVERISKLGPQITMQPEFLLRFGHSYRKQLGPERGATIKRYKSLLAAGAPLSFSSDRPIVPGDPWDGIRCSVRRPEGFDPAENIDEDTAIRLYTAESAKANGDPGEGLIAPGSWADFQTYAGRPSRETMRSVYRGGQKTYDVRK